MTAEKKRVVITAMGVVSSNGKNKEEFAQSCFNGVSGIKKCTVFPTEGLSTDKFGQIDDIDGKNRFFAILKTATNEMLADGNLTKETIASWGRNCRLFFGTLIFCMDSFYNHSLSKLKDISDDDYVAHMHEFSYYTKDILGVKGLATVISASCASGTTVAGMAFDCIRNGLCDSAVVAGADPLSVTTAYGFNSLKNLSSDVCNPFTEERDGINIGEAGAVFMFESLEHAKARGAHIYCEVAGYAIGNDAYHITSPDPSGNGAYRVMKDAIDDAGIAVSDIDYVNVHGTGTRANDIMEMQALNDLFGENGVTVSSTKALIGHCMGGSGGIELASVVLSLIHGKYICMPNLKKGTPLTEGTKIKICSEPGDIDIKYALSDSFAFGGNNSAIIVKKYEEGAVL